MASRGLFGRDRAEIASFLEPFGAAPYHRDQVFRWLYGRGVLDPAAWTRIDRDPTGERAG